MIKLVIDFILSPIVFNYIIMILYLLNAARWAINGNIGDCCYWLSAFCITATVTFLYPH